MENKNDNSSSAPRLSTPPPPPPPPLIYQHNSPPNSKSQPLSPFIAPRKIADSDFHQPCYLFVYGTLMDPDVLQTILSLHETPTLNEGWITGFSIKMWGIYPTLIPSDDGRVSGMAYKVETEEQFQRLAEYETSAYTWCPCKIYFQDGRVENHARTFYLVGRSGESRVGRRRV